MNLTELAKDIDDIRKSNLKLLLHLGDLYSEIDSFPVKSKKLKKELLTELCRLCYLAAN